MENLQECVACGLRARCKKPVPGSVPVENARYHQVGEEQVRIMLVGEAPGKNEDARGKPFVGQSGQELTKYLEFWARIPRASVYITNLVKCRPPGNRDPKPDELETCTGLWLHEELLALEPDYIIAAGAYASRFFLGQNFNLTLGHGLPTTINQHRSGGSDWSGTTIIPTYHPALGTYEGGDDMIHIQNDFKAVGEVIRAHGTKPFGWYGTLVEDPFNDHDATDIDDEEMYEVNYWQHSIGSIGINPEDPIAIDTEFDQDNKVWSIQVSQQEGTATFLDPTNEIVIRELKIAADRGQKFVFHQALADLPILAKLGIRPKSIGDTMIMSYLLGDLPQGLKALAKRKCGMEMEDYMDVVKKATQANAVKYLERVRDSKWRDPQPYYKWDKKEMKKKQPWNVSKKATKILKEIETKGANPWARWHKIKLDEGRRDVENKFGSMKIGMLEQIDFNKAMYYSCRDADATLRVYHELNKKIEERGLQTPLQMDLDILPMLTDMMNIGMKIDRKHFGELSKKYEERLLELEADIWVAAGEVFNPGSADQVADLLYGKFGIKCPKKTKTGKRATGEEVLVGLEGSHSIIPSILDYRGVAKLKGTYADPFPKLCDEDDRIHARITNTRARTGRLACQDPNLMNIPEKSEEGKLIKAGFIAAPGHSIVTGDFSQIELRLLAAESLDYDMIEAFLNGEDLHGKTAMAVFRCRQDQVKEPSIRVPSKTVNFGIPYGITEKGLQGKLKKEGIDWTLARCDEFIKLWLEAYPGVARFIDESIDLIMRRGYSVDMWGRQRLIPQVKSTLKYIREKGAREGFNHDIQAGAAGILKKSMIDLIPIYRKYEARGRQMPQVARCMPILPVHDQLLFEVHDSFVSTFEPEMKKIMEEAVDIGLPTPVDTGVGKTWSDAK